MGRLDDIQTALKTCEKKNQKKLKYIFMTILGLVESYKTINRQDPKVTLFDGLFIGNYKRQGIKILTRLLLFKSSICAIEIWDRYLNFFLNYALFSNVAISVFFSSFFIITFD